MVYGSMRISLNLIQGTVGTGDKRAEVLPGMDKQRHEIKIFGVLQEIVLRKKFVMSLSGG